MCKNKKTIGIITARGGSKSIPRKNIVDLLGKPLISYTIDASKQSAYLTRTIVSTDDDEIADIARKSGADVPFMRPSELAQDKSGSIEVVQHALNWLKENDSEEYDYVMILQPTSPLRTAKDIDACIEKIVDTDADSVMSMYELMNFSLKKLKRIENDTIFPLIEDEGKESVRHQDIAGQMYKRNCAVYLTKVSLIMKGDLFGKVSRPYLMSEENSVDVDSPTALAQAEFWMKRRVKQWK